ncbi:MAG: endonuclease/exonuclease/phosphatase family protein [Candidatus Omnitrophota bacterium]
MSLKLRVMTYNVHSCIGMDGKICPQRIAEVIDIYEPDIIALQELDVECHRTRYLHQPEVIAQYLNYHYKFYSHMEIEGGRYGNAVLSRYPMTLIKEDKLPRIEDRSRIGFERLIRATFEPRGALWVKINFKEGDLQVLATHLGVHRGEGTLQAKTILGPQWLNDIPPEPMVLCGDMNAGHHSDVYHLFSGKFKDAQLLNGKKRPLKTYPSFCPMRRIDHIFVNGKCDVLKCWSPKTRETKKVSDHLPLIADLQISFDNKNGSDLGFQKGAVAG